MSTIDTSTWNPDANLNTEIEGIPLNADASIQQTWQALRILMAAVKGDGDAIKAMIDVMQGATASADGASGLVPAPEAGDQDKFLKGDGTWDDAAASIDASAITSGIIDAARLPISSGAGWLRLPGNIQICWGTETISGNPDTVTFAKPFASTPATTVTPWHSNNRATAYSFTASGFSCRIVNPAGTTVITTGTTVYYIAIGTYAS